MTNPFTHACIYTDSYKLTHTMTSSGGFWGKTGSRVSVSCWTNRIKLPASSVWFYAIQDMERIRSSAGSKRPVHTVLKETSMSTWHFWSQAGWIMRYTIPRKQTGKKRKHSIPVKTILFIHLNNNSNAPVKPVSSDPKNVKKVKFPDIITYQYLLKCCLSFRSCYVRVQSLCVCSSWIQTESVSVPTQSPRRLYHWF